MSETVFVTGAAGCIGSSLTKKLLSLGKKVKAFDKDFKSSDFSDRDDKNLKIIVGDLDNKDLLLNITKQVNTVYHLGAKVHSIPRTKKEEMDFFKVNVEGTRNLLDACVTNNVSKFIFFSTVATIEEKNKAVINEKTPCKPKTAYSKSKYEAEKLIIDYHKKYSLFTSILKLPVVYGPHDKGNVKRLIDSIKKRQFRIIGNGRNLKSMVYVENVVDAASCVTNNEKANGETYIVSDRQPYSLNQIAQTIASALGIQLSRVHIPKWFAYFIGFCFDIVEEILPINFPLSRESVKKLTMNMVYSSEKIKYELGFKPKFGLKEGMAKTIAWYKLNKEEF